MGRDERIVTGGASEQERLIEQTLRPQLLEDFVSVK